MRRIVAHRGQQATCPENTLESIQQAIDCGAGAVEFDVQMTADQVPVVCHDISLQRTAGIEANISESRFEDIASFSVGEPARFSEQFLSVRLPSLQDMIALLSKHPTVTTFIELKDESIDAFGVETFVNQIAECIKPVQEQCVVIADNLAALLFLKQQLTIPVGWIIHDWQQDNFNKAEQAQLDYLVINHKYIPEQKYDFSSDRWRWVIYETRNPDKVTRLFEQGVTFVETNDICQMLKRLPGYK